MALLVAGDYNTLYKNSYGQAIPPDILHEILTDYGGNVTMPPYFNAETRIAIYDRDEYHQVNIDVWIDNIQSDLTLTIELQMIDNTLRYNIYDLHVL